ncbi:ABC transporter permease [Micromonospora sp. NPDC050397]|uniref:ABC transporter permease n=1 Tax=Micromonospora sp. NPDC050397 TaxID=3364279 RepID=UPI00384E60A8
MAYDESIYRRHEPTGSEPAGPGARDDSWYDERRYPEERSTRSDSGYPAGGYPADGYSADYPADGYSADYPADEYSGGYRRGSTTAQFSEAPEPMEPVRPGVSPAVLDDVFDDPAHGEPGRDRLGVHFGWEFVLLLVAGLLAYALYRADPDLLAGAALDRLLVDGAALGALALGAGLTLRAGAPNLALGPVAIAAALHFAENGDRGVVAAMIPAVLWAVAAGLVLALLVVGFHVPAWGASLAVALGVLVFVQQRPGPVDVQGDYDPSQHALYLFGGFAALALLGGLLGMIKAIRRVVGRFRPVADPARRRGGVAGTITALSIIVSMVAATLAGVLLAADGTGRVVPTSGLEWSGLALGAALVGGTSAYGRRGGVFGTLFAVTTLTLFLAYENAQDWDIALAATAAVTVAAGLVVTRLVESLGRPRSAGQRGQEWQPDPAPAPSGANWSEEPPERPEWSSVLPDQPQANRTDPWGDDRWGTER